MDDKMQISLELEGLHKRGSRGRGKLGRSIEKERESYLWFLEDVQVEGVALRIVNNWVCNWGTHSAGNTHTHTQAHTLAHTLAHILTHTRTLACCAQRSKQAALQLRSVLALRPHAHTQSPIYTYTHSQKHTHTHIYTWVIRTYLTRLKLRLDLSALRLERLYHLSLNFYAPPGELFFFALSLATLV